jgi:integrase
VDELARLLAVLPTPQDRLLVRFLAETGLRISELKATRWCDSSSTASRSSASVDTIGCSTASRRPRASAARGRCQSHWRLARELKAHRLRNGQPSAGQLVFTGTSGHRLDEANYRRRVLDPACARAGLTPIGFHVLRHTHGSIVAAATRDVRTVQQRLRHASASFTLETYVHLLDDRGGVSAVDDALRTISHDT